MAGDGLKHTPYFLGICFRLLVVPGHAHPTRHGPTLNVDMRAVMATEFAMIGRPRGCELLPSGYEPGVLLGSPAVHLKGIGEYGSKGPNEVDCRDLGASAE